MNLLFIKLICLLGFVALLVTPNTVFAYSPSVSGYVKSRTGTPIPGAKVTWQDSGLMASSCQRVAPGQTRTETTDNNGFFLFKSWTDLTGENGFGCLESPHTFTAEVPSGASGTCDTIVLGKPIFICDASGTHPNTANTFNNNQDYAIEIGCGNKPKPGNCPEVVDQESLKTTPTSIPTTDLSSVNYRYELSWDLVRSAQNYDISLLDNKRNLQVFHISNPNTTRFIISTIQPGLKYNWRLQANGDNACPPTSASSIFTINPLPVSYVTQSLERSGNSSRAILQWGTAPQYYDHYYVELMNTNGKRDFFQLFPNTTQSHILNLTKGQTYTLTVRTVSNVGDGETLMSEPRSSTFKVSTDQEPENICNTVCTILNNGPTSCTGNNYLYIQRKGFPSGQCGTACLACPAGTTSTGCSCQQTNGNTCIKNPICPPGQVPQLCNTP